MATPKPVEQALEQYREWHQGTGTSDPREIVSELNSLCGRYLGKSLSDLTGSIRIKAAASEYPPHRMLPWCMHQSKSEDSLVLIATGKPQVTVFAPGFS